MKMLMLKDVLSSEGWRREGQVYEVATPECNDYLKKGIAVEHKEVEVKEQKVAETKENKPAKKRTTKKSK